MASIRKLLRNGWHRVIVSQKRCDEQNVTHRDLMAYCKQMQGPWCSTLVHTSRGYTNLDSVFAFENEADALLFGLKWQ